MKVKIEIDTNLQEEEVIIRCRKIDERILKIQTSVLDFSSGERSITLKQGETEYYVPLFDILFFQTEGKVVQAHTPNKIFETEHRLYELEEMLPGYFMRISKSTIVNLNFIYSTTKNLASSSIIEFSVSSKKAYVSRNYYKALTERLKEKKIKG